MEKPHSLDLALALSGGGHRATLFAMGALLALVDRGLNKRVIQIASVSGGAITNAFVAQRCDFNKLEPGELDKLAEDLACRVVTQGVVATHTLCLLVLLPALLTGAGLFMARAHWLLWLGFPLLVLALSVMFLGNIVETLLDRRYFRNTVEAPSLSGPTDHGRACMRALACREVEHVFCSTDLVLGQPLYVSSHEGGTIWRRTSAMSGEESLKVCAERWEARSLTIAEVVRASASFPGIPPKRLSFGCFSRVKLIKKPPFTFRGQIHDPGAKNLAPKVAFLGDGGLWNNLGTHVLREDQFLRGVRQIGISPKILCINASAPLPPSSPFPYHIPGLGSLLALIQSVQILNVNTVQPRLQRMHDAHQRAAKYGDHLVTSDPLEVVADLIPVSENLRFNGSLCKHPFEIRRLDPVIAKWEKDIVDAIDQWGDSLDLGSEPMLEDAHNLAQTVAKKLYDRPSGDAAIAGMVDHHTWDDLVNAVDPTLLDTKIPRIPTTLGRLPPEAALRLLALGYVNTFVNSVFLEPKVTYDQIARLRSIQDRLKLLIPGLSVSR
ncbi:hypothetical protein G3N57_02745 [Paraburkholderia sp. Se-20369]|nr:hypothetical protein [Paraburkholderia sp. Se-20369]